MSGSAILDVVIGLVFVYVLISIVCSEVGKKVSDRRNWRADHLERGIRELLLSDSSTTIEKLYQNPLIKSLAPTNKKPVNIPARTFVLAIFDALVPNSSGKTSVAELHEAIKEMEDLPLKQILLSLVNKAESTIDSARKNIEEWYNAAEDRMTETYRQNMWKFTLLVGCIVSVILNVDTFSITNALWRDASLRSAIVVTATEYAKNNTNQKVDQAIESLKNLSLPIGYQFIAGVPTKGQCVLPPNLALGWCLMPNDWKDTENVNALSKIFGWLATALAGAQGGPFWFDILKKITQRDAPAAGSSSTAS